MSDEAELVHLDVAGSAAGPAVATITLDNTRNRNALSRALMAQLSEHLDALRVRDDVQAVVVAATGPAFCAGADMGEAAAEGMARGARALVALQRRLVALEQPVVARVHGPVRAGGLGIVGACDVVVCADTVSFAFTEVKLGLAPAAISLTTLPRLDPRTASWAFLTGDTFTAAQAQQMGLVTSVVPAGALDEAVADVVGSWCSASRQGLSETKRLLNADLLRHIDEMGEQVAAQSARLFASDEARAALRAFLDRRR